MREVKLRPRRLEQIESVAPVAHRPETVLRPLEDVVSERRIKPRDCRSCKNFNRDQSGMNFGWCSAHEQYVKLYHTPTEWYSQCTFKSLRRLKPQELELAPADTPPQRVAA